MPAGNTIDTREDLSRQLAEHARRMRIHVIRMTTYAGSGHVTSAFSAAEIVAALYFGEMRYNPRNMDDPDRDRFVLSKGHAAPILYAALHEAGVFDEPTMMSLRQPGSLLQGHPWVRTGKRGNRRWQLRTSGWTICVYFLTAITLRWTVRPTR